MSVTVSIASTVNDPSLSTHKSPRATIAALVVMWGTVLIAVNSESWPSASRVYVFDVYAAMAPSNLAFVCEPGPLQSYFHEGPDIKPCGADAPRTASVDGHLLGFAARISDQQIDAITADFTPALNRRLRAAQIGVALKLFAWWAFTSAAFLGCAWLIRIATRRFAVERWHMGQVMIVWIAVALLETVFFVAYSDVHALLESVLYIPSLHRVGFLSPAHSFGNGLLKFLLVTIAVGLPVGAAFASAWIWFSARAQHPPQGLTP